MSLHVERKTVSLVSPADPVNMDDLVNQDTGILANQAGPIAQFSCNYNIDFLCV